MNLKLYDTTLRDGSQREGISFSVEDKIKIARKLDELGVSYIEGGWPGANPKDTEFFLRMQSIKLTDASLVAFGSTRRANTSVEKDKNLKDLLAINPQYITLVGKGSADQVIEVLRTSLDENLAMISESIKYLKAKGITTFFDAEHFFDGYKNNSSYSLKTIETAAKAGADCIILCDTNGGSMPHEITEIVTQAKTFGVPIGIHAHNDMELAIANSLAAIQAGAVQVQGTVNGYGERCGNANLCSIIPAAKLKLGIDCISDQNLARLTELSRFISEVANLPPDAHLPYVGASAFGHKGGMHISAMAKNEKSYQHIDPSLIGNTSRILVSELSGMSTVVSKARERGLDFSEKTIQAKKILKQVKELESQGFKFDDADASFELLMRRAQPDYIPPFELVDFMVVVEKHRRAPTAINESTLSEAMVKVRIDGDVYHTAAEGDGPVNALDEALRKALLQFYPDLAVVKLIDYKVRILEESEGTEARVRVLIESSDGEREWRTVGSSTNIIEASWIALADGMEYWLVQNSKAIE